MSVEHLFQLILICGGPSEERGISLNSARSVMDHLSCQEIEIIPLYVDFQKNFYSISPAQLYSNTPADFDFKLNQTATALDLSSLKELLIKADLIFPLIHGIFGEDGSLQELLESLNVPFVGHSSSACKQMFHKYRAAQLLKVNGLFTFPQLLIHVDVRDKFSLIEEFFATYAIDEAVVKPAIGGSSIGVSRVKHPNETFNQIEKLFQRGISDEIILEPYCRGREFTVVVFQNPIGKPVALVPTEIEMDYGDGDIFDYRKKYLPTNQATYHTPARFPLSMTQQIRSEAERLFSLFGMCDFVRLDGWFLDNGKIMFSDINPLSGLEQNSFFFRQASLIGLSHRAALEYVVNSACRRYNIVSPFKNENQQRDQTPVYVVFGNGNAERQVSLMSGTNVWLKLLQSTLYHPTPFFLDHLGHLWHLPYSYTLNHTVEEIYANCSTSHQEFTHEKGLIQEICHHLMIAMPPDQSPARYSLNEFLHQAEINKAFVFIALHGAEGENGIFQKLLETRQISFNGSGAVTSSLCIDKYLTGAAIQALNDSDILSLSKKILQPLLLEDLPLTELILLWEDFCKELSTDRLIVKPRSDGCSAGIVVLETANDLKRYIDFIRGEATCIPAGTFNNQRGPIELSTDTAQELILEPYIQTDSIHIANNQLTHTQRDGWIELTVALLETEGEYYPFNPSITIAEGTVLSLEEKFQGGTGINLTPPPDDILSVEATAKIKIFIAKVAAALGIQNYARIDIFFNRITEKMIVIEANTLPALTPSTVIFQQGLSEDPPLYPRDLLERIVATKTLASSPIINSNSILVGLD